MKDKPVILVVDDRPQNIELLEAYLVPHGYEIIQAANGEEALGKLSGNQIDLILLDVMMPGMDGFEVTRRVRQDNAHRLLPIILITGLQGPEDRVKGIEAGCDDFLSKPYNNLELLARVQSLLKVKDYNDLMSNYQKDLESEVTGRTEELKHTLENLQQEITERKRTEEALRASEELFRNYLEYAPDGVYMSDVKGTFLYGNRRCEEIIGYRREELIGKNFLELNLLTEKSLNKAAQLLQANMEGKPTGPDEIELISKGGRLIPVEISTSMVQHMDQGIVLAFVRDITDRKQMEEKIRQMAYHDYLTGLPNRKLFYDRLGIALAQSQRNQKKVGIVMLDLDNFKGVNDTLGHDVGDLLLKAAVDRLSSALRKGDTVARFGGDEFVLIFPDLKGIEDTILVAQKIVDSFHKPFLIDTHQLVVTTSIGIAVYPNDGIDEDILLRNADIAMYQAKQAGRDRYQLCKKA
jgi:diguanylate cyclase (GGDEF)-like protein/PAS domain S-box-containing protein